MITVSQGPTQELYYTIYTYTLFFVVVYQAPQL